MGAHPDLVDGEEAVERGRSLPFQRGEHHVGRGPRVVAGVVVARQFDAQGVGEHLELVGEQAGPGPPRDHEGAGEPEIGNGVADRRAGVGEHPDVEGRVVRHERGAVGEPDDPLQCLRPAGGAPDVIRRDAVDSDVARFEVVVAVGGLDER